MAHRYLSWGQENWDGVGRNAVSISKGRVLGSVRAQCLQNSWLLKLYFQKPGSWNLHLICSEAESARIFSLIYSLNFSVVFYFSNIGSLGGFFVEEEFQKCAAAAIEVLMSPNVVQYEQMPLPVSVAGATALVEKAKLSCCGSQL